MKNDAWSMFHSPRCIIGASPVNQVPATSLETYNEFAWLVHVGIFDGVKKNLRRLLNYNK